MLNALKVVLMIENGIFLLRVFIIDIFYANWLPHDAIKGSPFAMLVFFHAGIIFCIIKMESKVNKEHAHPLSSFLFILIDDTFFINISLVKDGLLKGELRRK